MERGDELSCLQFIFIPKTVEGEGPRIDKDKDFFII